MTMARLCWALRYSTTSRGIAATRSLSTGPREVIVFPDDQMAVCWHPEQNFPYECSRALPDPGVAPPWVLGIREKDAKLVFARKKSIKETAVEMGKLTHTTMHRWFPRSRDRRAKDTKPDRPYL